MTLFCKEMESPLGSLKLVANLNALVAVLWQVEPPGRVKLGALAAAPRHPLLLESERQLFAYFSGARSEFDLPLEFFGSEFQKRVWRALTTIPFGQTTSYGALARAIGSPNGCRAVGAANARNPLAIVVPCHRVIGADGSLTGFVAGLEIKASLLAFEAERRAGEDHARG